MQSVRRVRALVAVVLALGGLLACAPFALAQGSPTPMASPASGTASQRMFSDPFAYCSAVGTIDAPDSRYTGPQVPEVVAQGLKQAFGAPAEAPLDVFIRGTSWRCMGGEVYACNVGANLPCGEKADTSRTPRAGMLQWCKENPNAEVIPAFASGRATVYEWKCTNGAPAVVRQVAEPDARGFLSHIWYAISPPQ
ncbi:MAG TPA: hypothetical protein VNP04_11125 [Alphaproteobacteria bacterium]|nr:hypothetical protein [Alphaproteobacteria bacterium]